MSHCLILQHDPAFGPGRVVTTFRDFGIPTRTLRLDEGETVPEDFDEVRLLVLLGGTQRLTGDAGGSAKPAWLDREIEAIRPMIDADRPVLGFGLGAQILAKAAGANVVANTKPAKPGETGEPAPYFGWGRLSLPFPGGTDPVLFGLHEGAPMFFWHKDSFELPKLPPPPGYDPAKPGAAPPPSGNVLLASAPHCKNAAFKFKDRLYGFQFHPELEREDFQRLATEHGGMAGAAFGSGALDRIRADTEQHFANYERLGTRLLVNYVQFFKAYNPAGVKA